jgi:hypothetical protein
VTRATDPADVTTLEQLEDAFERDSAVWVDHVRSGFEDVVDEAWLDRLASLKSERDESEAAIIEYWFSRQGQAGAAPGRRSAQTAPT